MNGDLPTRALRMDRRKFELILPPWMEDLPTRALRMDRRIFEFMLPPHGAMAALKRDGSVVTWGVPDLGGMPRFLAALLMEGGVSLHASECAIAALKNDGSVVVWGNTSAVVRIPCGAVPNATSARICYLQNGFGVVYGCGRVEAIGCYALDPWFLRSTKSEFLPRGSRLGRRRRLRFWRESRKQRRR